MQWTTRVLLWLICSIILGILCAAICEYRFVNQSFEIDAWCKDFDMIGENECMPHYIVRIVGLELEIHQK